MREIGAAFGPAGVELLQPLFIANFERAALAILIQRTGFRRFGDGPMVRRVRLPVLLESRRQRMVPGRYAEIGSALKHRQVLGLLGDYRRHLNPGGSGANHRNALAAKIHGLMRPLSGVIPRAAKVFEAFEIGSP